MTYLLSTEVGAKRQGLDRSYGVSKRASIGPTILLTEVFAFSHLPGD